MARMKQAPNFDRLRTRLREAELLFNLYEQAHVLYSDVMKGLDSSSQDIEILRDVAIQTLMALGITGEEIIEFLPETQVNGKAEQPVVPAH